jgi:hypothetical protein
VRDRRGVPIVVVAMRLPGRRVMGMGVVPVVVVSGGGVVVRCVSGRRMVVVAVIVMAVR